MRLSFRRSKSRAYTNHQSKREEQYYAVIAYATDAAHDRWKEIFGRRQERWVEKEFARHLRSFGIDDQTPSTDEAQRLTKLARHVAERAVATRCQARQVRIDRAAYNMRMGGHVRANRHREFGIGLGD